MIQVIKKLLGEYTGVDYWTIHGGMHLEDDLMLDENDVIDILNDIEEYFGVKFEEDGTELIYVEDLIAYVKKEL
ncbi:MAG: hypothetical protein JJE03_02645 [Peptostreptococcaceae bacterium]|nr:hypothetical protein [Peptostreptococcaceae bacterium]